MHVVGWQLVEKPVSLGGLELGNLRVQNRALLGKLLRWFPLKSSSLLCSIFLSKYGPIRLIGCWVGLKVILKILGKKRPWSFLFSLIYFFVWWVMGRKRIFGKTRGRGIALLYVSYFISLL